MELFLFCLLELVERKDKIKKRLAKARPARVAPNLKNEDMKLNIAVLAGDGIGPEITQQSIKVLKAIAERFDHEFLFEEAVVGASAIDLP